jgi:hypothetical protein
VVDAFSRFSPAIDARFSNRAEDVIATLERVCRTVGYPQAIRVDQDSEFIKCNRLTEIDALSKLDAIRLWTDRNSREAAIIRPF